MPYLVAYGSTSVTFSPLLSGGGEIRSVENLKITLRNNIDS